MADWVGCAAFLLRPVHERLFFWLKRSGKLFADETTPTSNAILAWADKTKVEWHCIAPGKPMQNAFVEFLRWPTARRVFAS